MVCYISGCLGNYNFDNIALFARKRFVDGCNTIDLMKNAKTNLEKEEIALVAMLDLNDGTVSDLKLDCNHAGTCKVTECRILLKILIKEGLNQKTNEYSSNRPGAAVRIGFQGGRIRPIAVITSAQNGASRKRA